MQYFSIKKYWFEVKWIIVLFAVFLFFFLGDYFFGDEITRQVSWVYLLFLGAIFLYVVYMIHKIRSLESICNSVVPQEAVVIDCVHYRKNGYSLVVVLDNMERRTPPFFTAREAKPLVGKKISCAVINKEVFVYSI